MPCPIARTFDDCIGTLALVDREHAIDDALGRLQRRARRLLREPEQQRNAQRPRERRGEQRVDRRHVRDDGNRAPSELRRERSDVARTSRRLRRRREALPRQFSGSALVVDRVGDHDDLVDARRERADLRERRAEHRMGRVDAPA